MKKFKINRARWIRGRGSFDSFLYRSTDRMMCCLGFYLRSCGVSVRDIQDLTGPSSMMSALPKQAEWLINDDDHSPPARALVADNDNKIITDPERERRITATFAKYGITVEFCWMVDEYDVAPLHGPPRWRSDMSKEIEVRLSCGHTVQFRGVLQPHVTTVCTLCGLPRLIISTTEDTPDNTVKREQTRQRILDLTSAEAMYTAAEDLQNDSKMARWSADSKATQELGVAVLKFAAGLFARMDQESGR